MKKFLLAMTFLALAVPATQALARPNDGLVIVPGGYYDGSGGYYGSARHGGGHYGGDHGGGYYGGDHGGGYYGGDHGGGYYGGDHGGGGHRGGRR